MVKTQTKLPGNSNIPQNSPNSTPKLDSKLSKSRQQINQENYQKNKEKRNAQAKARYQQQKELVEKQTKEQSSKYSTASAYKILISLKEYTELNQEKHKLWLNFAWTFKELADNNMEVKIAISDIIQVMKLREEADKLINDYWDTAKNEIRKGKSWNILDYDEQQRLIRYWGHEKARIENGYLDREEKLEKQSQSYLKEKELAKFHEERGKVKCSCYSCEEKKTIRKEIKAKIDKELKELEEQDNEKGECNECGKIRVLDEENGLCKNCLGDYGA